MRITKYIILAVLVMFLGFSAISAYKLYKGNMFIWLSDYLFNSPERIETDEVTDIIFVVVDHYEPGGNPQATNIWMKSYRELADKHIDDDGYKLQHVWSYPIEQFYGYEVDSLVQLCREGYGEISIQLHHKDDNSESLRRVFDEGIDSLQAHGALISADGKVHFSFVHGNWALDNSRLLNGHNLCGVDDEISILKDFGCFADITFPAAGTTSQPSLVNKIFYASDDPQKPKSHHTGEVSHVGIKPDSSWLILMQGPYMIDWSDWRFTTHPVFDDGVLYHEIPTTFHRFELWLKANVHVRGRPNWVFVRPFTHGAHLSDEGSFENILGANIDQMLTMVENRYSNNAKYRLHYMTAREMYNVVKAAEAGLNGNPNDYRDYMIKPHIFDSGAIISGESHE